MPERGLAAILAGGSGSRLGGRKPLVELGGRALIDHPIAAALEACLDVVVVAKRDSPLPALDVEVLIEPDEPRHALAGVVAALGHAAGRPIVAVACDMPFVTPAFLGWLSSFTETAAIPSWGGHLHPLIAHYGPAATVPLAAAVEAGHAAQEAVMALDPRVLGDESLCRFGHVDRLLMNVNTEGELELARQIVAEAL
ncbi:MAG: molybdenum cofactor guanylyltransferase [Thermoleophilaceae bacterium]|nr:molybdenum cofactor guanylyltransferase [Thermoleophilaceae bacterium]